MLTIHRPDLDDTPEDKTVIFDVEEAFSRLSIQNTETTRNLIESIDWGKYFSSSHFIDMFGTKL